MVEVNTAAEFVQAVKSNPEWLKAARIALFGNDYYPRIAATTTSEEMGRVYREIGIEEGSVKPEDYTLAETAEIVRKLVEMLPKPRTSANDA